MPRDGQLQQHNAFKPQKKGTRRRKIRNEEEQIAHLRKHVQSTKHPVGNTTAVKWSPYYRDFPESRQRNIDPILLIMTAMLMLDFLTLTSSAIQIPSSR
jgi:hypothetical protein